jgi:sporulation protein YlmC with PRC-barrel domain
MNERILFQKDASVMTAKGKKIGSLERVVLNPATKVVTDIVVRINGKLFTKSDKVVPIHLVNQTTESEIVLEDQAGELQYFPYFEESHMIEVNGSGQRGQNKTEEPIVYGYPQVGPMIAASSNEPVIIEDAQNIPEGTIAMKEGAKVTTVEGKHAGNVVRVLAEPSTDQVTHLIISSGLLLKEEKLIPIRWVSRIGENEIHLKVNKKALEESDTTPIAG